MGEYKTPGVYIKEKNAFGNSIVEVETAIPVFIGLTGTAQDGIPCLIFSDDNPRWNLAPAEQAGADFINDGVQHVFRRCTHTSVHAFF